jgi:hypothetical protein
LHEVHPLILAAPLPQGVDRTDDGLAAGIHGNMLHRDLLLPAGSVSFESLDLSHKVLQSLLKVRSALSCCGMLSTFIQAAREGHGRVVDGRHLRREHGFDLIPWFDPLDHREHEVEVALVHFVALPFGVS